MLNDFDDSPLPLRNAAFARGYRFAAASAATRRADKRRFARDERRRGRDYVRGIRTRARVASDRDVA